MASARVSSYVPAVTEFATDLSEPKEGKKVIVIGGGCGGLGAAWHLNRCGYDVELFEANEKAGGHANTVNVDGVDVDTGFMVYNSLNYPNLMAMFDELGIKGQSTTMGFSVSMDDGKFEWCAESLNGLLATPSNAVSPSFYLMMWDIVRFNKEAKKFLCLSESDPKKKQTTGEFLKAGRFSDSFVKYYLVPMTAAIWSASTGGILGFPAITLFTFLNNHLLLQTSGHIDWLTPINRSKEYVDAICKELGKDRVHCSRPVASVTRDTQVTVVDNKGVKTVCDHVVFACHPDQALAMLGDSATSAEKSAIGKFKYSSNDTYVHTDTDLMPKNRSAWTSWNYIGTTTASDDTKPVYVSYWLNRLQHLKHDKDIFVSLNPSKPPAKDKILYRVDYTHPQYSTASVAAQREVAALQGENNTYFCGAWMGYGFHEDGFRSGIEVATNIAGVPVPWVKKYGQEAMMPAPSAMLAKLEAQSLFQVVSKAVTRPIVYSFEVFCEFAITTFLKGGLLKGQLTFINYNGKVITVKGKMPSETACTIRVKNPWFWVRLALEADLGFSKSYIAGEWDLVDTGATADGLTTLLLLLADNMPTGKERTSGGMDAGRLVTAWVGSAVNYLWYYLTMDNSIANSRANIHAHYDISNELYKTFLDKDHMMYSSAIFDTRISAKLAGSYSKNNIALTEGHHMASYDGTPLGQGLTFHGTLEQAQLRKIDLLLAKLEPLGPQHTLLDIGFGWGGICLRAAEKYGCRVTGITLSTEQKALAEEKVRAKGLSHLISFELCDYRVFARERKRKGIAKFDRIVSCEMIEAVGLSHLPTYFQAVEDLLDKQGIFVMQAITMPEARFPVYSKSADFLNTIIFPGGLCPSLASLLDAMATKSTLHLENVVNTNLHYAETLRQWRYRFNTKLPKILEQGFDDTFIRLWNLYLCMCEAGFEAQIINLQVLTFSRPGNPNMLRTRAMEFATSGIV